MTKDTKTWIGFLAFALLVGVVTLVAVRLASAQSTMPVPNGWLCDAERCIAVPTGWSPREHGLLRIETYLSPDRSQAAYLYVTP